VVSYPSYERVAAAEAQTAHAALRSHVYAVLRAAARSRHGSAAGRPARFGVQAGARTFFCASILCGVVGRGRRPPSARPPHGYDFGEFGLVLTDATVADQLVWIGLADLHVADVARGAAVLRLNRCRAEAPRHLQL
jgi:hypothetical protein